METKRAKQVFGFIAVMFAMTLSAQTTTKWQQVIGGGGTEYGYRVRACLDQGYIVAGSTSSTGISDGYVVRTDSFGIIMWTKYFIGNNVDVLRSIRQLPDSGYILVGFTNSGWDSLHGGYDGWVIRTDKNGNQLWMNCIGTQDWDFFYDVTPTYDSCYVIAGGTYGRGSGDEDMYFVKIDDNGDTLWTKTYGGVKADEARAIVETGDSMLATCGFTCSMGDTLGDGWILRMDEITGDTVWARTEHFYGAEDKAWGIADGLYNQLYFCGEVSSGPGNLDPIFGAYSYNGDSLYIFNTGGSADEIFYGIVSRPDGSFATIGSNFTTGQGNGDMFMFHNYIAWQSFTYGTADVDEGYSIDLAHDNGYIACGYTTGFNSFQPNIYLVKMDSNGTSTPQGVLYVRDRPLSPSRGSATLFPNPVNSQATLLIDAVQPFSGELAIEVFDIAGRKVTNAPTVSWDVNSQSAAVCKLNTEALTEGVYHFIISDASGHICDGKFVVIH